MRQVTLDQPESNMTVFVEQPLAKPVFFLLMSWAATKSFSGVGVIAIAYLRYLSDQSCSINSNNKKSGSAKPKHFVLGSVNFKKKLLKVLFMLSGGFTTGGVNTGCVCYT